MDEYGRLTEKEALQSIINSFEDQNDKIDKMIQTFENEALFRILDTIEAENNSMISLCELLIHDLKYYRRRDKMIEHIIFDCFEKIKKHDKDIVAAFSCMKEVK